MKNKYILSIDQGTTGTRALVFDHFARPVSESYQEIIPHYPHPGWVEQDPEEIWQSTINVIRQALTEKSIPPSCILSIGISNQRETAIFWNKNTGQAIGKALVWQCRRSSDICQRWREQGLEDLIKQKTGLPIDPYPSASKIKWAFENLPSVQEALQKGSLAFGTVDSWLIWKLTGGKMHITDYTNASRTMLFNIKTLEWDEELLNRMNIPSQILPELAPSSSIFGYTEKNFFPSGVPIGAILGDQQASLFGHGCSSPGMAKNTYGTGCFLLVNSGKKSISPPAGLITTVACDSKGNPCYSVEGSVFIAGAAVQWLRDELGIIDDAAQTENMALAVEDTAGVYFVPALVGLGAPYWDMEARGAILGITRGTKKEHIVRASLEGIAYQVKDILEVIRQNTDLSIEKLRVDGGASKNNFLMQFQSDILDIPIERTPHAEVSALGVALLAGITAQLWEPEKVLSLIQQGKTFFPEISEQKADILYRGWKRAVSRILTQR